MNTKRNRNGWVATLSKFAFLAVATLAFSSISALAKDKTIELPQIVDATGDAEFHLGIPMISQRHSRPEQSTPAW